MNKPGWILDLAFLQERGKEPTVVHSWCTIVCK